MAEHSDPPSISEVAPEPELPPAARPRRPYRRPELKKLGLLRQMTGFSF